MSERIRLGLITVGIIVIGICVYLGKDKNKTLISEFRNSEVLICYGTLIVTSSNWSLSGNHLINNNSAGYVDINQCSLKDKR